MKFLITSSLAVCGLALVSCSAGSLGSNAVQGAVNGAVNSIVAPVNPANAITGAVNNAITPAANVTTPTATSALGNIFNQ